MDIMTLMLSLIPENERKETEHMALYQTAICISRKFVGVMDRPLLTSFFYVSTNLVSIYS